MKTTITYDKGEWSFESDVLDNGLQIEGLAVQKQPDQPNGPFDVRTTLSGEVSIPGRNRPIKVYEVYNYESASFEDFFTDARKAISKQGNRAQRMSKILHKTQKLMVIPSDKKVSDD